jgi:TatD DNase family protein
MLCDAHCHPYDLLSHLPEAENERQQLNVICAASSSNPEEFEYNEQLSLQAKESGAAPILLCYAIHPQMCITFNNNQFRNSSHGAHKEYREEGKKKLPGLPPIVPPCPPYPPCLCEMNSGLNFLESIASEKRIIAVGETGFDLYNAGFRETEKIQEELFAAHIETALRYDLPVVIHVRKAMFKIFAQTPVLKKCKAVIFHSWPGTLGEAEALLKRGINAFFSFGTVIKLNHREAKRCCALFPSNRLLCETDAPFQPLRGRAFSRYADLKDIIFSMAELRREAGTECSNIQDLENNIETNFYNAFLSP